MVKPCITCDAVDRYADGRCRPCALRVNREWYRRNKDERNKQQSVWYYANLDREQKKRKKWRKDYPDKLKQANRKWQQNNKDRVNEKARRYRMRHPNRHRAAVKRWIKNNPERANASHHNYRARKRKAKGHIYGQDKEILLRNANGRCQKCGTSNDLTIDHIVPLAIGGDNTVANAQVLCRSCNSRKWLQTADYRDKDIEYWKQLELIEAGGPT